MTTIKTFSHNGIEYQTFHHCGIVGYQHSKGIVFRTRSLFGGAGSVEEAREWIIASGQSGTIELVETVGHGYWPATYTYTLLETVKV
jgi:hypothetical protein